MVKESGIPNAWGGGAFWNFRLHRVGKISMPPVVGVQIFSGTTQLELFMEKSWSFISQFCVNPVLL